jgi:hypothetical protein
MAFKGSVLTALLLDSFGKLVYHPPNNSKN